MTLAESLEKGAVPGQMRRSAHALHAQTKWEPPNDPYRALGNASVCKNVRPFIGAIGARDRKLAIFPHDPVNAHQTGEQGEANI